MGRARRRRRRRRVIYVLYAVRRTGDENWREWHGGRMANSAQSAHERERERGSNYALVVIRNEDGLCTCASPQDSLKIVLIFLHSLRYGYRSHSLSLSPSSLDLVQLQMILMNTPREYPAKRTHTKNTPPSRECVSVRLSRSHSNARLRCGLGGWWSN